jgi:hypothetical protein
MPVSYPATTVNRPLGLGPESTRWPGPSAPKGASSIPATLSGTGLAAAFRAASANASCTLSLPVSTSPKYRIPSSSGLPSNTRGIRNDPLFEKYPLTLMLPLYTPFPAPPASRSPTTPLRNRKTASAVR